MHDTIIIYFMDIVLVEATSLPAHPHVALQQLLTYMRKHYLTTDRWRRCLSTLINWVKEPLEPEWCNNVRNSAHLLL